MRTTTTPDPIRPRLEERLVAWGAEPTGEAWTTRPPGSRRPLHGDVHHGNVLDLGGRWVAVDTKGLAGHPAFDLANLFCNPREPVAVERMEVRFERIADRAGLAREVLAGWVVAWCELSLAWSRGVPDWHDRAAREVATRLLPDTR